MSRTSDPSRDLLFGLLALQNGLIDQGGLFTAFAAWSRDKGRSLADYLVELGHLDAPRRAVVEAIAGLHLQALGGDPEKSLGVLAVGRSTRESLARAGGPDVEATLGHVARALGSTHDDDQDPERTGTYSVGSATSDGERFRILRPHARGGLGAVFVALDGELHREVALKQILERFADDPVSRQRFVAEAEITGGLEHPGVVPVYGLGTDAAGRPYYAMRFIKGDSLKEAIARFHKGEEHEIDPGRRSLALRKLLRRFLDVCNAIDYAHSRGVIHRDLKPANIILGKHGETLVVDWGLAKSVGRADPSSGERTIAPSSGGSSETLPGSALGTPAYMSPEQASGELHRLGPWSDVYSLGATLYCLLTGKPPFESDDIGELLRSVQSGEFPPPRRLDPSIDKALEAVCKKAMAQAQEDRYATPRALAEDIERWMADEPVTAWRDPWTRRLSRWLTRHRTGVSAAGAALLVALVGLGAVATVQARANSDLRKFNGRLTQANEQVTQANADLSAAKAQVEDRFHLATDAIRTFHTGVSTDVLLKQKEFGALRKKLLEGARGFYRKLETVLEGQADRDSRLSLCRAYSEVAELTENIESNEQAMAIRRRAVDLLEALDREHPGDTEIQHELGRSLRNLGITGWVLDSGKTEAVAALTRARQILEALVAANRSDPKFRADLASTLSVVASLGDVTSPADDTLDSILRARDILEELVAAQPSNVRIRQDLAVLYDNLGVFWDDRGKPDEAIRAMRRSIELLDALVRSDPTNAEYAIEMVRSYGNLGSILPDLAESLEAYRRAGEASAAMAGRYPTALSFQRDQAWLDTETGRLLGWMGRAVEGIGLLEGARATRERLLNENPKDIVHQRQLSRIDHELSRLHTQTGQTARASVESQRGLATARKLAEANPGDPEIQSYFSESCCSFAEVQGKIGHVAEAMAAIEDALAIRRRMAESRPKDVASQASHAGAVRRRADVLQQSGRAADAVAEYRRALTMYRGLKSPRPLDLYDMACCQALFSGAAALPGSGMSAALAESEGATAVNMLRAAIQSGYRTTGWLRVDSDLDALRSRGDFQLLLMDLAMPAQPFAH